MKKKYYQIQNEKFYQYLFKFSNSIIGKLFLGIWAFLEPSFWFIAADMPLQIMSFVNNKKFKSYFLIVLISSILGIIFYYTLNLFYYDKLRVILEQTPFVTDTMISRISGWYDNYGVFAVLFQSVSFMSVKIWTSLAIQRGFSFFPFILFTTISRAFRFFIVAIIASYLGIKFEKFIKKNAIILFFIYIIGFILLLIFMES